jgi:hypothetical protein
MRGPTSDYPTADDSLVTCPDVARAAAETTSYLAWGRDERRCDPIKGNHCPTEQIVRSCGCLEGDTRTSTLNCSGAGKEVLLLIGAFADRPIASSEIVIAASGDGASRIRKHYPACFLRTV